MFKNLIKLIFKIEQGVYNKKLSFKEYIRLKRNINLDNNLNEDLYKEEYKKYLNSND